MSPRTSPRAPPPRRAPLVVDLNAIAPETSRRLAEVIRGAGCDYVDGSISGPPPWKPETTRIYLSGERASDVAALPLTGVERIVVGAEIGSASAVKMSTASVYKGTSALLAHALLAAHANGVLEHVLDDLRAGSPELVANAPRRLANAAAKSERYVAEMREIALAQSAAGLTPALFEAMAEVFSELSRSELGRSAPEDIPPSVDLDDVLGALRRGRRGQSTRRKSVHVSFSGIFQRSVSPLQVYGVSPAGVRLVVAPGPGR